MFRGLHRPTRIYRKTEKSALRRIVNSGEIKLAGFVHDDVGGRFSILDDATIFTLFFLGVSKEEVKELLEGSLSAQKEFLELFGLSAIPYGGDYGT